MFGANLVSFLIEDYSLHSIPRQYVYHTKGHSRVLYFIVFFRSWSAGNIFIEKHIVCVCVYRYVSLIIKPPSQGRLCVVSGLLGSIHELEIQLYSLFVFYCAVV